MRGKMWIGLAVFSGLLLVGILLVGQGLAQGVETAPPGDVAQGQSGVTAIAPGAMSVQGRLTDAAGNPLDGTYEMTFRLYEVESGGTAVCSDTNSVDVAGGLFNSVFSYCRDELWGQKVWLSVEVGSDGEMSPRQALYAVPYAISLVPGAEVSGTLDAPILSLRNANPGGMGLSVYSAYNSVYAETSSADMAAGCFYNSSTGQGLFGASLVGVGVKGASLGGIGVYAASDFGPALAVDGHITSTARSYLWISGNDVRPWHADDTTIVDADTIGGAVIRPGGVVGPKSVMLPISVLGPLYGQDVTVSGLDIYWVGSSGFDGITGILLRRQTGVCDSEDCYVTIFHETADQICSIGEHPTGCTAHFDLDTDNVLTEGSGILYLTFSVNFGGAGGWVQLGGVRLTLEHN